MAKINLEHTANCYLRTGGAPVEPFCSCGATEAMDEIERLTAELAEAQKKPEPTVLFIDTDGMRRLAQSVKDGQGTQAGSMAKMVIDCCDYIVSLTAENEAFKREKAIWIMTHNVNVEKIQQLTAKLNLNAKENHKKSNRCNCGYC